MQTQFTSRFAFLMVTAGAAVGLGNIWAFPFVAGQSGGSGFIAIYLVALLVLAAPAMICELVLGRMGQASPPTALARVKVENTGKGPWSLFGWSGLAVNILVLSFYAVIAGQAAYFGYYAFSEGFSSMQPSAISALDNGFKINMNLSMLWTILFLGATLTIVSLNITKGIENAGRYLMPSLFVLLIGLALYSMSIGNAKAALNFLFGMDSFSLTTGVFMAAVGQAFFTLSVGICSLMMYGAYMGKDIHLPKAVSWIVLMDLMVAIIAGLVIFPLVFASDVTPDAGPGLIFMTLPLLFAKLPAGDAVATFFFLMLTVAALTSSISMMAPVVARLEEAGLRRITGAFIVAGIAFVLSFMTILSFGPMYDYYPLEMFEATAELNMFELLREGINNIYLPLGGLAFTLLVGWGVRKENLRRGFNIEEGPLFSILHWIIKYLTPFLLLVMIAGIWL
ncbi:sodium-dependent transporter [Temperatibacter marinus]|uniref:Sodium-dependent transporter n=1 Tax=Temperatibacter marinus TaxID=1456591 RepID=A0AA52H9S9_9PROT|nr:sodium-dependent transporter [Temperatibacter marinus]WND02857.1 sodium-dependent transporter [Temperatibacter marinus]